MTEPQTPVQSAAAPPRADTRVIVTTSSHARAYGPYTEERGKEVAEMLNEGSWQNEYWETVEIRRLPGEQPPPPMMRHPLDAAEVKPLYEVLERRQQQEGGS